MQMGIGLIVDYCIILHLLCFVARLSKDMSQHLIRIFFEEEENIKFKHPMFLQPFFTDGQIK